MDHDEAVNFVVPLSRDDRKVLLEVLMEEMWAEDIDKVLQRNGYVSSE